MKPSCQFLLALLFVAFKAVLSADAAAPDGNASDAAVVQATFDKLVATACVPAWRCAHPGAVRTVSQNEKQIYDLGMPPVIVADVLRETTPVGYVMLEAQPPHRLVEFGVDAENPFSFVRAMCQAISGVPNLQQFPVAVERASKVASGCVPTAGANVIAYWASHGFPAWLNAPNETKAWQAATIRLRNRMSLAVLPDETGYTDDAMPLTGSSAEEIVAALRKDAAEFGVELNVSIAPFTFDAYKMEIAANRPPELFCAARLPHKPQLSWLHAVTGIGWADLDSELFVMIHDNFYPTKNANAVRWLQSSAFSGMVTVSPKTAGVVEPFGNATTPTNIGAPIDKK